MLTGRAAEMAGYESSDEEPDSYNVSSHRFSNPDQVKMLLKSKKLLIFQNNLPLLIVLVYLYIKQGHLNKISITKRNEKTNM